MPTMSKPRPYTIHVVHAGDLAYAAMDAGNMLVPVRVIEFSGDIDTYPDDVRVTVAVTGSRSFPFERGEVMRDLPASYIVARKATGTRKGERVVIGATVVVPPDCIRPDCGHIRVRPDGIGTGYATDPATGLTMCYTCADVRQLADMATADTITAYLSQDERHVTTWTGGTLARVLSVNDSPGNRRKYVRAVDDNGVHWRGTGPRESGTYVTLHRVANDGGRAMRDKALRIVSAYRQGLITNSEVSIELASLAGVDISCLMGECQHTEGK